MILNKKQKEEFEELAKPLMKYLAENHHPHMKVVVESDRFEVVETSAMIINNEFIK